MLRHILHLLRVVNQFVLVVGMTVIFLEFLKKCLPSTLLTSYVAQCA